MQNWLKNFCVSFTERKQFKMFNMYVSLIKHIHQNLLCLLLYHFRSQITVWQIMLEFWAVDSREYIYFTGLISVPSKSSSRSWHLSASSCQTISRTDCPYNCTKMHFTCSWSKTWKNKVSFFFNWIEVTITETDVVRSLVRL